MVELSEAGGDDADLLLLEKIQIVDSELKAEIDSVRDIGKIEQSEQIEKIATRAALKMADISKGDPGDSYILTEEDKNEIASKIEKITVVEKVVEKTEVIREIPAVTEIVKTDPVDPMEVVAIAVGEILAEPGEIVDLVLKKAEAHIEMKMSEHKMPSIVVSSTPPQNPKDGDVWIRV